MDYYRVTNPEGLCILVDLADDIENMATIILEEIDENAPLTRYKPYKHFESRKYCWNNRADFVHAMAEALFTMVSELHSSLTELDSICNPVNLEKETGA